MRDLSNKMAELKFEAPLAQFEESDEWGPVDFQSATASRQLKAALNDTLNLNLKEAEHHSSLLQLEEDFQTVGLEGTIGGDTNKKANGHSPNQNSAAAAQAASTDLTSAGSAAQNGPTGAGARPVDNFTEAFGGSLEDLVNTFDEKITKCFGNYETSVEELAPVQVRSQEEIMNECQMWWTITGNFGNILPIDWTKSYARQMHMPALQLGSITAQSNGHSDPSSAMERSTKSRRSDKMQTSRSSYGGGSSSGGDDDSDSDEAVANDLDMHALILGGMQHMDADAPIQTVEEVIKEIDDLMDETTPSECGESMASTAAMSTSMEKSDAMEKAKEVLGAPLYAEKLQNLKTTQLNELYVEMEVLIREFSETLIAELALRDELEYEKELKNTFISLLLGVQNKRRQFHVQKKRGKAMLAAQLGNKQQQQPAGLDPKYLTTVIPYHLDNGPPDNQALQVLIKILKAINEDSPTVPTLLTDYILKVLCPT